MRKPSSVISSLSSRESFTQRTSRAVMGTFGLWKYIANHNVQYAADKPVTAPTAANGAAQGSGVDHLFLDMNCILHQCYAKEHPTAAATLKHVLSMLQRLLVLYPPKKSLVVVFDGPAPIAKLRTQRERRISMMKNPQKTELNQAQIVTGSTFVLDCEAEVTKYIQTALSNKKFGESPIDFEQLQRVVISGSRTPGEGEIKIAEELRVIYDDSVRRGCYTPDDRLVIVGNDSDLILVCVAAVPYHNFYLISPSTFVATYIGELFAHWSNAVPNGQLHLEMLTSFRLDFVFIMLLAGGDHYCGVEDSCLYLWRKYRKLRSDGGYFRQSIVRGDEINWDFLRSVVARDHSVMQHYVGSKNKRKSVKTAASSCPAEPGFQLLKGVRWSHKMLRGEGCLDFHLRCRCDDSCSPEHLRSALQGAGVQRKSCITPNSEPPLRPLEVYCAVLGAAKYLPAAVNSALESKGTAMRLHDTLSTSAMVTVVKEAFEILDTTKISGKEKTLLSFADPTVLIGDAPQKSGDLSETVPKSTFEYPLDVCEIRLLNLYDHRYTKIVRSKASQRHKDPTAVDAMVPQMTEPLVVDPESDSVATAE